jgi:hypothetical protein
MQSFVVQPPIQMEQFCGGVAGDETGVLALVVNGAHADKVFFVDSSGVQLGEQGTSMFGAPLQQLHGFAELSARPYLGPAWAIKHGQEITTTDSSGKNTGTSYLGNFTSGLNLPSAADPKGGVLLAGDLSLGPFNDAGDSTTPVLHAAILYQGGGTDASVRWGPVSLASAGVVLGVGVDLLGRSLVITDGSKKFGGGSISAQWFDEHGGPISGEFLLIEDFTPGSSTWFETTALHGGGLLVRRMDATFLPGVLITLPRLQSQALVTVGSGSTSVQPAPEWMTSRKNVKLQLSPNGRAYVALPYGADAVSCSQRVEILALDGTSCGATDYAIAAGTCDSQDMRMTADGTIVQPLPTALEQGDPDMGGHTCTWRWWPRAVR